MIIRPSILLATLLALAHPALADAMQCYGTLPAWSLSLTDGQSVLTTDRNIPMEVMDITTAEGDRDWPRALTLVGRSDTAIVLIDQEACQLNSRDYPYQAQVLTQYGTVPILLTGCCEAQE